MKKIKLSDVLEYEQPSKYIVESEQYKDEYKIPVLTAGKTFILGYTNEEKGIYHAAKENPIILFDDFTTDCRYINFDFKVKSSAVKILKLKRNDNNLKYLYYLFKNIVYDTSSHKRYWISQYSKFEIKLPNIEIQNEIVKEIGKIEELIENKEKQIQKLNELIKSKFAEMFENEKYPKKCLIDVCEELFAGGDVKKEHTSRERTDRFKYPIYTNGENLDGLYGYTDIIRVDKEAVTISARGTIGFSCIRKEPFYPAVRLIVTIPNKNLIDTVFLRQFIENKNYGGQGAGIPQLTVPMIKNEQIPIPPIKLQKQFANIVEQINNEKMICVKIVDKLNELKESKMQEYFGGVVNE